MSRHQSHIREGISEESSTSKGHFLPLTDTWERARKSLQVPLLPFDIYCLGTSSHPPAPPDTGACGLSSEEVAVDFISKPDSFST